MHFDLAFSRHLDGSYRFDQYQATLQNAENPSQAVSHRFSTDSKDSIRAEQAQNLLAGRAVINQSYNPSGGSRVKWVQLDFNGKDPAGNHIMKESLPGYGLILKKQRIY